MSNDPSVEALRANIERIDAVLGDLAPMLHKCAPTGESAKAFGLLARACGSLVEARDASVQAYACFGVRPT